MEALKLLFFKENEFSWRKALTAISGFVFAFSCIGYQFGLNELPKSYQGIIAGVFAFYFTKKIFEGMKLTNIKP